MKMSHLSEEQFIGYVYRTLTDTEREAFDAHLVECQHCRAHLTRHQAMQRRIHHHLQADVKSASPSSQMNFAAIAPRLKRRRSMIPQGQSLLAGLSATAALAGLAIALVSLQQNLILLSTNGPVMASMGTLPMLACFCLAFALVRQFDWTNHVPQRFSLSALLAFLLWLGTAVIGLQIIVVIRDLFVWAFIYTGGDAGLAFNLSSLVIIASAIGYIAIVIGGAEYHYKHIGQRNSWLWFGWTIVAELLLLVIHYLL